MRPRHAIGLDLGGTTLNAGLVDETGAIEHFVQQPCRVNESAEAPLLAIEAAVRRLRDRSGDPVAAVGLGLPGAIDPASGALVGSTAHLPHWSDFPIRDTLAARLELPVVVDNDANAAAFGEYRCGAARGARLAIMVTVGTGVGCGIVADGAVVRGARGGAGEIGHLAIGSGAVPCDCGVPHCIEPEMSGSGLARDAARAGHAGRSASELFAAAERGDAVAAGLVDTMARRLALALSIAIDLLNPDVVVIGGGVMNAGEPLLARLRAGVRQFALESHHRELRLVASALGERSGVAGAGLLALAAGRA
jgi:glucokinase